MNTDELRSAAKKRLKAQHDFKQFLAVWGAVSVLLVVIWLLTGAWGYFWPIWPIFVMGIAVLFVGLDAYGPSKHITEDAIDAEVARLVDRQQQRAAARAAAAQPTYEQGQQYTGGQTASYDPSVYQNGQTGQAPVYDPSQYQRQAGSHDTAQYQTGPTAGYGAQPSPESATQAYTGTQQYGTQEQPSPETTAATVPTPPRTTEPTPTEQFAAVFSGTGLPTATDHAPSEPAESIVLESTATGDTETVTAAADETQARLDGETPAEHVSTEGTADGATDRATTSAAAAPAATVSAPRKTTTRSTTPRKPAAKAATAAGTTVRKTSSTRASTGAAAPKAAGAKAPAAKATGTTGTKRTTSASTTDGTPKAPAAKAPAKPRTTKPKVTPTEAPTTATEPGTAE
jgi:hypothetical protein